MDAVMAYLSALRGVGRLSMLRIKGEVFDSCKRESAVTIRYLYLIHISQLGAIDALQVSPARWHANFFTTQ